MSPLTVVLLAGAGAGVGIVALAWELRPPRPSLAATLDWFDPPSSGSTPGVPAGWLGRWLATRRFGLRARAADLLVLGRTPEQLASRQALAALAGALGVPVFGLLAAVGGTGLPWPVPGGLAFACGAAGWWLPIGMLRHEANEARRRARDALSAYLDTVALGMAAGRNVPEALSDAAALGGDPLVVAVGDALADARLAGAPAWTALGRLGAAWDLPELRELAATLALVYDEGAKARTTLLARAAGLRSRQLTDAAGRANARSEVMLAATFLLYAGFAVLLGYPALIRVFLL